MSISGINHITLATSNVLRSIHFYQNVLGCDLVATWKSGAHLLAGNMWLCLSFDENTKVSPPPEYTHIAFQVKSPDFGPLVQKLKEYNVLTWKKNISEGDSFYFLDPDHNKLELHTNSLQDRLEHMQGNSYPDQMLY